MTDQQKPASSPRAQAKRDAYQALPVAKIVKPLKFIRAASRVESKNEKGETIVYFSPVYFMAKDFAKIGDGYSVQKIAMEVNRSL